MWASALANNAGTGCELNWNLITSWGVPKCSMKNFQFTLKPAGRLFLIKAQTREPDYWTFLTFFRVKTVLILMSNNGMS